MTKTPTPSKSPTIQSQTSDRQPSVSKKVPHSQRLTTPKPSPSPNPQQSQQTQENLKQKHKHMHKEHKEHKEVEARGDPTAKQTENQIQMQLPPFRSILTVPRYTFDDFGGYQKQKDV